MALYGLIGGERTRGSWLWQIGLEHFNHRFAGIDIIVAILFCPIRRQKLQKSQGARGSLGSSGRLFDAPLMRLVF